MEDVVGVPGWMIKEIISSGRYGASDNNISNILSHDTTYRIRQLIQRASQFSKHSKRSTITIDDLKRANYYCNFENLYPVTSSHHRPSNGGSTVVDLSQILNNNGTVQTSCVTSNLSVEWLTLDGEMITSADPLNLDSKPNMGNSNDKLIQEYYHQITTAIVGNDKLLTKIALDDLSSNNRVSHILPNIISFIYTGVKLVHHDVNQLTNLMHTVRAILQNNTLYLATQPYLSHLVSSVMYCICEPLTGHGILSSNTDHWTLRDTAAHILAHIICEWSSVSGYTDLSTTTLHALIQDMLMDNNKHVSTHYGALKAVTAINSHSCDESIIHYLRHSPYIHSLHDSGGIKMMRSRIDLQHLFGALMECIQLMLLRCGCGYIGPSNSALGLDVYTQCYEVFGDSLLCALPILSQHHLSTAGPSISHPSLSPSPTIPYLEPLDADVGECLLEGMMLSDPDEDGPRPPHYTLRTMEHTSQGRIKLVISKKSAGGTGTVDTGAAGDMEGNADASGALSAVVSQLLGDAAAVSGSADGAAHEGGGVMDTGDACAVSLTQTICSDGATGTGADDEGAFVSKHSAMDINHLPCMSSNSVSECAHVEEQQQESKGGGTDGCSVNASVCDRHGTNYTSRQKKQHMLKYVNPYLWAVL